MNLLTVRLVVTALLLGSPALYAQVALGESPVGPRQVILLVGDGMDEQQVTIARNYLVGAAGKLLLDRMPLRSAAQVLTSENKVDGRPVYVADSANTATSMATGAVTSRGRIATTAGSDQPLRTIVELANEAGLKSGIVSTASVTDATPAAFASHINFRLCENPDLVQQVTYRDIPLGSCAQYAKANGGAGSISEQLAGAPLSVLLGGGLKHFQAQAEGEQFSVLELARRNGFQVAQNSQQLVAAAPGKPLLGLFAPSTLPVRLQGEDGREAESPEPSLLNRLHPYLGDVTLPAPMVCEPNPDFESIPSLKTMTDVALAHLSHDNSKGFFLMVESASIDKQSHERKPCGSIGELQQLEEALQSALAFAKTHRNTLIMVTADHSQAAQLIPEISLFAEFPIPTYTPGKLARIITPEGSILAVNYATTNFQMEEHTGAAVPLYANSEGVGRIPSFIQQTDIFDITRHYLNL